MEKAVEKRSEKRSEKTRDQIIRLLQDDPTLSAASIAEKLGIAARVVERHFSKLKTAGLLSRVGADNGGKWIVNVKNGN